MKKALVLSLIIGLVNVANSGLHLAYDNSSQAISIHSDEPLSGGIVCYVGMRGPSQIFSWDNPFFRTSGAPVSQPQFYYYSPQEISGSGYEYNLGVIYIAWGDPILTPNPAGFWCSPVRSPIDPMLTEYGLWQVDLLDNDLNVISTLNFLPEPCTLLLLGVGGMLMRRK